MVFTPRRASEFLQQMNKSDASAIIVRDDSSASTSSPALVTSSPSRDRKGSMHRRAASDGSKIYGQLQRVVPLGMTCTLSVLCDFYRPAPECTILLSGPRSSSLRLASSVTPLKVRVDALVMRLSSSLNLSLSLKPISPLQGEIFLNIEAPFINPIRTKLSPKACPLSLSLSTSFSSIDLRIH